MKKIILTTVFALLLSAMPAAAEAGTVSLIPSYGILLSPDLSDYDDVSTGGLGFTLQGFFGSFRAGEKEIEWGAEIGTQSIYKYEYTISGTDGEETVKATPVMGLLKYNIESEGEFKPYMLIGGGLYNIRTEDKEGGSTATSNNLKLAMSLGLGGRIAMENNYFVDAGMRYSRISTDTDDDAFEKKASLLNIGLGIGKQF